MIVSLLIISLTSCVSTGFDKELLTKENVETLDTKSFSLTAISLQSDINITDKKQALDISVSALKTLVNHKVMEEYQEESYRIDINIEKEKSNITLNDEQQNVVNTIVASLDKFTPYLLYGVTGSGKTEVYMRVIEDALQSGKTALMLVPEISLTPQMFARFKNAF